MKARAAVVTRGLRHLALKVVDVEKSKDFYLRHFGMRVVWQPDPDNVYLSSGCDNLALHRVSADELKGGQRLDHLGFIVASPEEVDRAAEILAAQGIPLRHPPRTHRDGSRSLYFADPDGNVIQVLYEPTISPLRFAPEEQ
jgi:catechol 2,3-dioxygenase-like lactoylglutathione lyase family enzyme